MTFERFSQIWEETVSEAAAKQKTNPNALKETGMNPRTKKALLAYAKGDKLEMEKLKKEFYEAKVFNKNENI